MQVVVGHMALGPLHRADIRSNWLQGQEGRILPVNGIVVYSSKSYSCESSG